MIAKEKKHNKIICTIYHIVKQKTFCYVTKNMFSKGNKQGFFFQTEENKDEHDCQT